ncbi:hypothetical protein T484DRAFT_1852402 [Baffinella frigidus]|nr:hypothetical protein T484DRAFT_1852402 [Cryptophyta sp. CCMP2293]
MKGGETGLFNKVEWGIYQDGHAWLLGAFEDLNLDGIDWHAWLLGAFEDLNLDGIDWHAWLLGAFEDLHQDGIVSYRR